MSSNEIQAWIENDPRLNDLILKIEAEGGSNEEKAERAFFALADLYNLDRMPNQSEGEGSSLFVEHAFLKYMAPNDDPRGRVLTAAYHIVNEMAIPAEVIAEKALGKEPEEGFQVGLRVKITTAKRFFQH